MNIEKLTDEIIVEQAPNHIHVEFGTPYQVISSAVLGGGFAEASHILNLKVEKQVEGLKAALKPPDAELSAYCDRRGWKGITVGMMTAASMDSFRMAKEVYHGVNLSVMVTAGLSNARRAGDTAEHRELSPVVSNVGTINIICLSGMGMTPAAMVEAVMTVAEARAAALQNLDIKSPISKKTATGTGTDCIAIAADSRTDKIQYCGKHMIFGEILARLVIEALTASIERNSA